MSNAVTNIITLLQIFQGLSALPVLTPLRPACQTAVVILQQAQVCQCKHVMKDSF